MCCKSFLPFGKIFGFPQMGEFPRLVRVNTPQYRKVIDILMKFSYVASMERILLSFLEAVQTQ